MVTNFENKLKEMDIRPTAMRLLVLEALSGQETAISLSDPEMHLKSQTG